MYQSINDAAPRNPILATGEYKVYYLKLHTKVPEDMRESVTLMSLGMMKDVPGRILDKIPHTHVLMGTIKGSENLDDIITALQGEFWSPNGEAYNFIVNSGASHTSMSVGDVIETPDGRKHIRARFGFKELE